MRAFHADDNVVASDGEGVGKQGATEIRNGYREHITGFWGFIHSLLLSKYPG
jgi:hypothetical protein